ncbi:MAG: hypothetical protein U0T75_00615 [Chitinophagales bacterium]
MTPSADLFQLIHALTPSEKRYFKLFAQRHVIGSKNYYEKLFDAFEALPHDKEYDEAAFKRSLKGKAWAKNFAVQKSLLQELVLSAMHAYHVEKTEEGKLNKLIVQVQFLYDKGLFEPAYKLLSEALIMAAEREHLPELVILYQLKNRLSRIREKPEDITASLKDFEEETVVLKQLETERQLTHLRRRYFTSYLRKTLREQADELRAKLDVFEETATTAALTAHSRMTIFNLRALLYESEGKFKDALELNLKASHVLETEKEKLPIPSSIKRQTYANVLACALYSERFDLFEEMITKLEALPANTFREMAEKFRLSYTYKLLLALNTSYLPKEDLYKTITTGLEKYQGSFAKRTNVILKFNLVLYLFRGKRWNDALREINNLYAFIGRDNAFLTYQRDLRLLEIMCNLSLRENALVDYQLESLSKWLRQNELSCSYSIALLKDLRGHVQPKQQKPFVVNEVPIEWQMVHELYLSYITNA